MKQILVIFLTILAMPHLASAQRLVYNDKAPTIEIESTIKGTPILKNRAIYIDFFTIGAAQNKEQLIALENLALKYNKDINIVLIAKENKEELIEMFKNKPVSYTVLYDLNGKTFKNFGVKFVPFSVLIDKKGNFIWQGNNKTFPQELVRQAKY